ncbi:MAG: DUF2849 domain-containing protein [Kiloniellales bacterium]|nr:DUF2849 domain-containing protein [Kiloniellales bacterium]
MSGPARSQANPQANPKVMTANLLRDGDVVYLTAAGTWSLWLHEAAVARDEGGAADLEARAKQAEGDQIVVGAYLMTVFESESGPQPIGTRERIRAKGPTVHPEFGKQAMTSAARDVGAERIE